MENIAKNGAEKKPGRKKTTLIRIPVTLVYEGDYETGMGWNMEDFRF